MTTRQRVNFMILKVFYERWDLFQEKSRQMRFRDVSEISQLMVSLDVAEFGKSRLVRYDKRPRCHFLLQIEIKNSTNFTNIGFSLDYTQAVVFF